MLPVCLLLLQNASFKYIFTPFFPFELLSFPQLSSRFCQLSSASLQVEWHEVESSSLKALTTSAIPDFL